MVFRRRARTTDAGVATVEMAIVITLLLLVLFGIVEFGLLIKDLLGISQAAREGVRAAVVGWPTPVMTARADSSVAGIDTSQLTRTYEYREFYEDSATFGPWQPLLDIGAGSDTHNNARPGDQVRVSLTYPHTLVTPFYGLFDDEATPGIRTLAADMVMRRE